jgi:hypothetical protein
METEDPPALTDYTNVLPNPTYRPILRNTLELTIRSRAKLASLPCVEPGESESVFRMHDLEVVAAHEIFARESCHALPVGLTYVNRPIASV